MDIVLIVYDKVSFQVSSKIFDGVQSFINDGPEITPIHSISIDDFVSQNKGGLNFQELLRKHIIDKKLFSKIINGHIPNKHSVMALGLALELDLQEYETFLATANFALNPSDMFDTVVKYCVTQKIYDVMQVDSLLFQMDLPCFND